MSESSPFIFVFVVFVDIGQRRQKDSITGPALGLSVPIAGLRLLHTLRSKIDMENNRILFLARSILLLPVLD